MVPVGVYQLDSKTSMARQEWREASMLNHPPILDCADSGLSRGFEYRGSRKG